MPWAYLRSRSRDIRVSIPLTIMLPASDSYPTRFFCIFLAWDAFAHLEDQTKKSLESVEEEKLFLPVVDVTGHRHARLPASTRHPGLTSSLWDSKSPFRILSRCFLNSASGWFLVMPSAYWFSLLQNLGSTNPASNFSLEKWYRTPICLVRCPIVWFLIKKIQPWLSS